MTYINVSTKNLCMNYSKSQEICIGRTTGQLRFCDFLVCFKRRNERDVQQESVRKDEEKRGVCELWKRRLSGAKRSTMVSFN